MQITIKAEDDTTIPSVDLEVRRDLFPEHVFKMYETKIHKKMDGYWLFTLTKPLKTSLDMGSQVESNEVLIIKKCDTHEKIPKESENCCSIY